MDNTQPLTLTSWSRQSMALPLLTSKFVGLNVESKILTPEEVSNVGHSLPSLATSEGDLRGSAAISRFLGMQENS
jgi:hypothetical protein